MFSGRRPGTEFVLLFIASAILFGFIYIEYKWFFVLIDMFLEIEWVSPDIKLFFYDRTQRELLDELITPLRGSFLIFGLFTVVSILLRDIYAGKDSILQGAFRSRHAVALFIVLAVLVTPTTLGGSALQYADTSVVLFTKMAPIDNLERLLLPALAHLLFFRGYGFYFVFSLFWNFALICALLFWLSQNRMKLPFWELVSLATTSFILFQFMGPGYPDVLIGIFVLLALALPLSERGLLSLFILSLISHEGSIFIWAGLVFLFIRRVTWQKFLLISLLYMFMRFMATGFDIGALFLPRVVGGMTTGEWLKYNPDKLLLGIFFAFKLGWVIIGLGMVQWFQKKDWRQLAIVSVFLGIGGVLAVYGIDTSRLAGWVFPALLFAWKEMQSPLSPSLNRASHFAKALNLLVPPVYVGLNGIVLLPGLYKLVYDTLVSWFSF